MLKMWVKAVGECNKKEMCTTVEQETASLQTVTHHLRFETFISYPNVYNLKTEVE